MAIAFETFVTRSKVVRLTSFASLPLIPSRSSDSAAFSFPLRAWSTTVCSLVIDIPMPSRSPPVCFAA